MKLIITLISLFSITNTFASAKPNTEVISFYTTEEFPYQVKSGEGATYEIIEEMYKLQGSLRPRIHFLPWKRAYTNVKNGKNKAIFSISRNPSREKLFDWCCYLYRAPKNEFFSLRGHEISSLSDLKNKSGAVWRGDTSEILIDGLVKKIKGLQKVVLSNNTQAIKMLLEKRVDFIITKESLLFDACHTSKINCRNIIHSKLELKSKRNKLYIGLSKRISKKLKRNFVKMFNKFKGTLKFQMILKKYSLEQ